MGRAVERMLVNWHTRGSAETAGPIPQTSAGAVQATGSSHVPDRARSADDGGRVGWEEQALIRHWQEHLAKWPSSAREAPLSARHARPSSTSGAMTSRGPMSARSAGPGSQKASRKRPSSARAHQAWSAEPLSARAPLSAQDVLAGHAAWLQGFHQDLTTAPGAP